MRGEVDDMDATARGDRVYFVSAPSAGMMKIGFTNHPIEQRLAALQRSSPIPLSLAGWGWGGRRYERALHEFFADRWSHGEWFRSSPEMESLAHRLGNGGDPAAIIDPAKYTRGIFVAHVMAGVDTERVRSLDADYVPAWVRDR